MSVDLTFDATRLRAELAALPVPLRAVFAALCARRLVPGFQAYAERAALPTALTFQDLPTRLWRDLTGEQGLGGAELEEASAEALALIPPDDADEAPADDAAAALTYAYRARRSGDPQEAVWAATRAVDAADLRAQRDHRGNQGPHAEAAMLGERIVQAELERQADDLRALHSLGLRWGAEDLEALRANADAAAEWFEF